ncbi:elongator complex protein 6 [Plasmopara halstedii]|uniref:Elongator complex protein 6 n=1 Tax=Plasmopara halstedii TaxID=4781 RepID=A0A0P1AWZ3_PLAHL|nr:elongator complex protein 6 [Plasmopara halstedii]CEG46277.1 elongator complex protein 6 [Plasmopara halstedii]|eukprot:XP_024582646.1 elongator complex protein 6 [Plasmopara halstedii]
MAESLYHLSESLVWMPTSAPQQQLVIIQDCVEASGSFLVHHFTSLFLKAGHRVCVVSSANSPEHHAAVGRKLGINFATCQSTKQLYVLNWTRLETQNPKAAWMDLFNDLKRFTDEENENAKSIVLDDVSALNWRFGEAAVLNFVRCCKTLTHEKNGGVNVVLLTHADTDLPASRLMSPALADMATVVLTTRPLPSGYSKDIHGTLSIHRQSWSTSVHSLDEEPNVISYKILENTIKCFPTTGETLRRT